MRQIERMVVGLELGARPLDAPSAEQPRRIVFDVSAPTWALLEEARQALTSETGGHVDDDALVNALARALLGGGGTRDEGRSAYQIALSVCDRCQTVTQRAGADDIVVDELVLDVAQCDATHVGRVDLPGSASTPAKQSIPPRVRREVSLRHGKRCALPGCRHAAFVELHHSLVALCDGHHTAFKEREAQRMIDCAKSHVRRDATVEDAVRVALRQAPLPVGVREELASYERIVA